MKVRSHLHRPVAAVAHLKAPRLTAGVQLDRIRSQQVFAWNHPVFAGTEGMEGTEGTEATGSHRETENGGEQQPYNMNSPFISVSV
jgi:hypothetical protein